MLAVAGAVACAAAWSTAFCELAYGGLLASPAPDDGCPALIQDRAEIHALADQSGWTLRDLDGPAVQNLAAAPLVRQYAQPREVAMVVSAAHATAIINRAGDRMAVLVTYQPCGMLESSFLFGPPITTKQLLPLLLNDVK